MQKLVNMQCGNSTPIPDDVENIYMSMHAINEPVYVEFDPDLTLGNNNHYDNKDANNEYLLIDLAMVTLQCIDTLNFLCVNW